MLMQMMFYTATCSLLQLWAQLTIVTAQRYKRRERKELGQRETDRRRE